jgi:hypothetical protein
MPMLGAVVELIPTLQNVAAKTRLATLRRPLNSDLETHVPQKICRIWWQDLTVRVTETGVLKVRLEGMQELQHPGRRKTQHE